MHTQIEISRNDAPKTPRETSVEGAPTKIVITDSDVADARHSLASQFGTIVTAAKMGDPVAAAKLRVFADAPNEAIGIRLALMNRAQRQRFYAEARRAGKKRRKRARDA